MSGRDHIHPDLLRKMDEAEDSYGIEISEIPIGTKINVQTRNTLYKLKKIASDKFEIEGGKYFPETKEASIAGCTFGGSMLKAGWIIEGMYMEIWTSTKGITTSSIQKITIMVEAEEVKP